MELFEAMRGRHSVRKFTPEPLTDEDIREIITAATLAPNAGNQQLWRFIAIKSAAMLKQIEERINLRMTEIEARVGQGLEKEMQRAKRSSDILFRAPTAIAVLTQDYRSWANQILGATGMSTAEINHFRAYPHIQSIGAAIQNLLLAAHSKGYGGCWMVSPLMAGPQLEELLEVEAPWRLAAMIPLGVPAQQTPGSPRKPLDEVLRIIS